MDKSIKIPESLSHLKVDHRGYPIPFFVPIVNGEPNFKFADQKKQILCIDKGLCHICGIKLIKGVYYFISGPLGLKNKVVTDPAMHKHCAEFALAVCPHMFFEKAERKAEVPEGPSVHAPGKPSELYLIKSDKYEGKFHKEIGYRLVHFRVTGSDKYIYVNNKLQKA
jgi:hypothetical protein